MIRTSMILSLLFFSLMLYSCGDTRDPDTNGFKAGLEATDATGNTSSVFIKGQPVQLEIYIENLGDEIRSLQFNTGERYDIEVYNSGNTLIWNLNFGKVFHSAIESIPFNPYEIRAKKESWDQKNNDGNPVDAGTFSVQVVWKAKTNIISEPCTLVISE